MFKPIRDFLTFIQKNSTTNGCEENEIDDEDDEQNGLDNLKSNGKDILTEEQTCLVTTNELSMPNDSDEDDIELQIKSSVMHKNPTIYRSLTSSPTQLTPCATMTLSDHNQNLQKKSICFSPEDDDELSDFKNAPITMSSPCDDFHSVNSSDELRVEEVVEEIDSGSIKREIFVVVENDLNTSIASSSGDDPLAIDITKLSEANRTFEESDEICSVNEVNWFASDVDKSSTKAIESLKNITGAIDGNRKKEEPVEPVEIERCDNSDSGLGIETSSLHLQTTPNNSITESSSCNQYSEIDGALPIKLASSSTSSIVISKDVPASSQTQKKSLRSNLKRRYCAETDLESSSSNGNTNAKHHQDIYTKKPKRTINFDAVQVYYFPRQQGFGCVPSAGGCTLGMGTQHVDYKRLTLAEHAAELRRAHRLQLQEVNPRGSSSEETDESEEDYLSEGSGSDLDADSNGFLQPVPPKQRRAILKAAGVRKIDTSEKIDCRNIRNSREVCGCTCRDFCDPETCSCSRAGIKCQVDRAMFPCGCSRDACGNTTGRVEFNPARVRTHFIHTIMRLDMENRQQQQPPMMTLNGGTQSDCVFDGTATLSTSSSSVPSSSTVNGSDNHSGYYNMHTQSNYSSGYASPAYTSEHNANFYQSQSITTTATETEKSYHSLDSVDGVGIVPSFNEITPNYCPNNSNVSSLQFNTTEYHTPSTYTSTFLSYQSDPQQPSNDINSCYPTTSSQQNKNNNNNIIESSFSSCSVPSQQPYGIATVCNSPSSLLSEAAETEAEAATSITSNDNNFISLSTPITSSSRLSQINDLLQNNRNNTALVAISQHSAHSNEDIDQLNTANASTNKNSNLNNSVESTPSVVNETPNKASLSLGSNLTKAPLSSAAPANSQQQSIENETTETTPTPPIDYDSRVAVADFTI